MLSILLPLPIPGASTTAFTLARAQSLSSSLASPASGDDDIPPSLASDYGVTSPFILYQIIQNSDGNKVLQVMNRWSTTPVSLRSYELRYSCGGGVEERAVDWCLLWPPPSPLLPREARMLRQYDIFTVADMNANQALKDYADDLVVFPTSGRESYALLRRPEIFLDVFNKAEMGSGETPGSWVRKDLNSSAYPYDNEGVLSSQWRISTPGTIFLAGMEVNITTMPLMQNVLCGAAPATDNVNESLETFGVGTFMVDNLLDGHNDSLWTPDSLGNCTGSSAFNVSTCGYDGASTQIGKVAGIIDRWNLNLVNIVGVENCGALSTLADSSSGGYGSYFSQLPDDQMLTKGVGLMSQIGFAKNKTQFWRTSSRQRYPVLNSGCNYTGSGETGLGAHYIAHLKVKGKKLTVIGVDLAGNVYNDPLEAESCAKREAQALLLQPIIQYALQMGREVILLGNLNDLSRTVTDNSGLLPNSTALLTIMDVNGNRALGDVEDMRIVTEKIKTTLRYTANVSISGTTVLGQMDFVIVSPNLFSDIQSVGIDHAVDRTVSTRFPVYVTFNISQWPVPSEDPSESSVPDGNSTSVIQQRNFPRYHGRKKPGEEQKSTSTRGLLGFDGNNIPFVAASLVISGSVLIAALLALLKGRQYIRTRKVKRAEEVEDAEGVNAGAWRVLDSPAPAAPWRPIDRSLPTIKSGEQLDMGLYTVIEEDL